MKGKIGETLALEFLQAAVLDKIPARTHRREYAVAGDEADCHRDGRGKIRVRGKRSRPVTH